MEETKKSGMGKTLLTFGCGIIFGVILSAFMGGVAYWYTNTRLMTPEEARPANAAPQFRVTIPRTFMQVKDNGRYDNFLVRKIGQEPVVPFLDKGEEYWQAFVCKNEKCPGRALNGGKSYVFAGVVENGEITGCPLCAAEYAKAAPEVRNDYDPHNFRRYYLPEAVEMIKEFQQMRKEMDKKREEIKDGKVSVDIKGGFQQKYQEGAISKE